MTTPRVLHLLGALFIYVSGCSDSHPSATTEPPEAGTPDAHPTPVAESGVDTGTATPVADAAPLDGGTGSLGCSTRTTLVGGVTSAENLLFLSGTGRLFVSGDDGIFEVTRGTGASVSLTKLTPSATCKFGGMTQVGAVVFANCYDLSDSHLYAANVDETSMFDSLYDLPGVQLANGLTSDSLGQLYIASTFDGRILRLTLSASGPLKITDETDLGGLPTPFAPNGIKQFNGSIYLTSGAELWKAGIPEADGGSDFKKLVTAPSYLDDLFVTESTIYVADFGGPAVLAYGLDGTEQGATPKGLLANPSSVVPALGRLGLGQDDLVVTEKPADRVAVVHPCAK